MGSRRWGDAVDDSPTSSDEGGGWGSDDEPPSYHFDRSIWGVATVGARNSKQRDDTTYVRLGHRSKPCQWGSLRELQPGWFLLVSLSAFHRPGPLVPSDVVDLSDRSVRTEDIPWLAGEISPGGEQIMLWEFDARPNGSKKWNPTRSTIPIWEGDSFSVYPEGAFVVFQPAWREDEAGTWGLFAADIGPAQRLDSRDCLPGFNEPLEDVLRDSSGGSLHVIALGEEDVSAAMPDSVTLAAVAQLRSEPGGEGLSIAVVSPRRPEMTTAVDPFLWVSPTGLAAVGGDIHDLPRLGKALDQLRGSEDFHGVPGGQERRWAVLVDIEQVAAFKAAVAVNDAFRALRGAPSTVAAVGVFCDTTMGATCHNLAGLVGSVDVSPLAAAAQSAHTFGPIYSWAGCTGGLIQSARPKNRALYIYGDN